MRYLPGPATLRSIARFLGVAALGGVATLVSIAVVVLNGRPDLSAWHTARLDEEFSAESPVTDFAGYLALEERLFAQLDETVYAQVPANGAQTINRYRRGSPADPSIWPVNWNRSFELVRENPVSGVLLLHGLSDSPYSLRALGEQLHANGAHVVGLRIPGHGTAPSALVDVRWQDMAAAVAIAARHVKTVVGHRPLYIVGYSHGGALAVDYALASTDDPDMPVPARLVLISPEIGITGSAGLAVWQARLGRLLGLDKLAWNVLKPEYEPFKYGSFAVNAGDLAYRITLHLDKALAQREKSGRLGEMPPILAFQSAVDATVTARGLVENLFARLPSAGHELVLFDINRRVEIGELLTEDPQDLFEPLMNNPLRRFDLTLVGNERDDSSRVVARTEYGEEGKPVKTVPVGDWPAGIYSLSHVALPFPPDDSLYGGPDASDGPGVQLGNLDLRGERGVLRVSGSDMLRLRWNPFYEYLAGRTLAFLGGSER